MITVDPISGDNSDNLQSVFNNLTFDSVTSGSYVVSTSVPTVRLNPGIYNLSRTVYLRTFVNIIGDGAVIQGGGFNGLGSSLVNISGVNFVNSFLSLSNNNINASMFSVRGCKFDNSGITLGSDHLSAMVELSGCRFRGGYINTYCDHTAINGCWIQWPGNTGFYISNLNGHLAITNSFFVPQGSAFQRFWIKNLGTAVTVIGSRFSGENGGIPILSNQVAPNDPGGVPTGFVTYSGANITLFASQLSAGPKLAPTSVVVSMDELAGSLDIRSCFLMMEVPIITISDRAKGMLATLKNKPHYHIDLVNQKWPNTMRVPPELLPYMV